MQRQTFFAAEGGQRSLSKHTGFPRIGFRHLQPVDNFSAESSLLSSRSLHFPTCSSKNSGAGLGAGRLMLVAPASFDAGASRALLAAAASDANSLLLFPKPPEPSKGARRRDVHAGNAARLACCAAASTADWLAARSVRADTTAALLLERSGFGGPSSTCRDKGQTHRAGSGLREVVLTQVRRESLPLEDLYSLFKTQRLARRHARRQRNGSRRPGSASRMDGADLKAAAEKRLSSKPTAEGVAAEASPSDSDEEASSESCTSDSSMAGKKEPLGERDAPAAAAVGDSSEATPQGRRPSSIEASSSTLLGRASAFQRATSNFALSSRTAAAEFLGEGGGAAAAVSEETALGVSRRAAETSAEELGGRALGGLVGDSSLAAAWQAQQAPVSKGLVRKARQALLEMGVRERGALLFRCLLRPRRSRVRSPEREGAPRLRVVGVLRAVRSATLPPAANSRRRAERVAEKASGKGQTTRPPAFP